MKRKSKINKSQEKVVRKLRAQYRLIIMNDTTYEPRFSYRLSILNSMLLSVLFTVVIALCIWLLVAFTPLRSYIIGYDDVLYSKELARLNLLADTLQKDLQIRDRFIQRTQEALLGNVDSTILNFTAETNNAHNQTFSGISSLYRSEVPEDSTNDEVRSYSHSFVEPTRDISTINFFTPVKGLITNTFKPQINHYGVDVVARENEAIKAVMDGTVILAEWTSETGHVIGLQHSYNLISFYKHNSVLLKKQGSYVKAGEVIAIIGNSGELTTGPHLHFELWEDGSPVDPQDYMVF